MVTFDDPPPTDASIESTIGNIIVDKVSGGIAAIPAKSDKMPLGVISEVDGTNVRIHDANIIEAIAAEDITLPSTATDKQSFVLPRLLIATTDGKVIRAVSVPYDFLLHPIAFLGIALNSALTGEKVKIRRITSFSL
ncbi:MAG: hypothetical protein ACPG5P_06430 [Saprospiraceae bacterium]